MAKMWNKSQTEKYKREFSPTLFESLSLGAWGCSYTDSTHKHKHIHKLYTSRDGDLFKTQYSVLMLHVRHLIPCHSGPYIIFCFNSISIRSTILIYLRILFIWTPPLDRLWCVSVFREASTVYITITHLQMDFGSFRRCVSGWSVTQKRWTGRTFLLLRWRHRSR